MKIDSFLAKFTSFLGKILLVLIGFLILVGCSQTAATSASPIIPSLTPDILKLTTTPMPSQTPYMEQAPGLFVDAGTITATPNTPTAKRYRFVKLDRGMLLNAAGEQQAATKGAELSVNLFADTHYTGVIDSSGHDSTGLFWFGHLKDIEYSTLTIVFTGDVFIFKFASPAGVYEVSSVDGSGLYQIIEIDQNSVPGKEG